MAFFDGSFKRSPAQNLGGNSNTLNTVLQQALLEREEREKLKRQIVCAIKIQAKIRGYLCRKRLVNKWKSEYAEIMFLSANPENQNNIYLLGKRITLFNKFINYSHDYKLNCEIIEKVHAKREEIYLILRNDISWVIRIRHFMKNIMKFLGHTITTVNREFTHILGIFERFTNNAVSPFSEFNISPNSEDLIMHTKILYFIFKNNFLDCAIKFLISVTKSEKYSNQNERIKNFLQIIMRPLTIIFALEKSDEVKDTKGNIILAPELIAYDITNVFLEQIFGERAKIPNIVIELLLSQMKKSVSWKQIRLCFEKRFKEEQRWCKHNYSAPMDFFMLSFQLIDQEFIWKDNEQKQDLILFFSKLAKIMIDDMQDICDSCNFRNEDTDSSDSDGSENESSEMFNGFQIHFKKFIKLYSSNFLSLPLIEFFDQTKRYIDFVPILALTIDLHQTFSRPGAPFEPTMNFFIKLRGNDNALIAFNNYLKGGICYGNIEYLLAFILTFITRYMDDEDAIINKIPYNLEELSLIITKCKNLATRYFFDGPFRAMTLIDRIRVKVLMQFIKTFYERNLRKKFLNEDIFVEQYFIRQFPVINFDFEFEHLVHYPQNFGLFITDSDALLHYILIEFPQLLPFDIRLKIWKKLLANAKFEIPHPAHVPAERVSIRRAFMYEDAFHKIFPIANLRKHLQIVMINIAGAEEPGIDGGGLMREFLTLALKAAANPNLGLFSFDTQNRIYPNSASKKLMNDYIQHFSFIGKLIGKALFEEILVELPLSPSFIQQMSNPTSHPVDFLETLDPELYKHLLELRKFTGDWSSLGLDFTYINEQLGEKELIELVENGAAQPVTNLNYEHYIFNVANYKINRELTDIYEAFRNGLRSVIPFISLFSWVELQSVISGTDKPIDLKDWENNTSYATYTSNHPTILLFWKVVQDFDEEKRRRLLKFVTSCSRPPLLGFQDLQPSFAIHHGGPPDHLPTAGTCVNLLKLPEYQTYEQMKEKILYSISAESGFELS